MKLTVARWAKICGIITAVIVVLTTFTVQTTPFFDLPFFKMLFPAEEIETYRQDSQKMAQDILTDAESKTEEERKTFEESIGLSAEKVAKIAEKPSIHGLSRLAHALNNADGTPYDAAELGLDQSLLDLLAIFRWVLYLFSGITLLLVLLGIFTKKIAFPIIAIIFSAVYFVFLAGLVYYILFIAFAVLQMVFQKRKERTV